MSPVLFKNMMLSLMLHLCFQRPPSHMEGPAVQPVMYLHRHVSVLKLSLYSRELNILDQPTQRPTLSVEISRGLHEALCITLWGILIFHTDPLLGGHLWSRASHDNP